MRGLYRGTAACLVPWGGEKTAVPLVSSRFSSTLDRRIARCGSETEQFVSFVLLIPLSAFELWQLPN
jgi:hypothetical protein